MNKIRRILISLPRTERVVVRYLSVRIRVRDNANNPRLGRAPSSREPKPKISLSLKKRRGVCRGEPQKIERKFYGFVFVAS